MVICQNVSRFGCSAPLPSLARARNTSHNFCGEGELNITTSKAVNFEGFHVDLTIRHLKGYQQQAHDNDQPSLAVLREIVREGTVSIGIAAITFRLRSVRLEENLALDPTLWLTPFAVHSGYIHRLPLNRNSRKLFSRNL